MLELTPAQRSALRADAHALNPVVIIGEAGLTPAVMKEIGLSLDAHGLIKIRVFGDDREARLAMYDTICREHHAAPIQHIGKLLVVYRPKKEAASPTAQKGKGLRNVTIIKQGGAAGQKRTVAKKVTLKGNQRVTAGGMIKKAKKRLPSLKKAALDRKKGR